MFRYMLVLCLVLFVFSNEANSQEQEARSVVSKKLLKEAVKLLGKKFAGAAFTCLEEAAENCKSELKHVDRLVKCAGDFLKENKGRCLIS